MYKSLSSLLLLFIFNVSLLSQFHYSDLEFFVGSGTDTTMLVVDFKDASFDSSYAWGYLYSGTKTGEDLLMAVAKADENFQINIDTASFGNFLQDIIYIEHTGLGGQPDFWSTWDGMGIDSLSTNNGIASTLMPGGVFGVSYTDFNPAVAPGTPLPAYDPEGLKSNQVQNWTGSGSDSTLMIIDFADGTDSTSFVWGYLFNDSVSYLTVLADLDQADTQLSVVSSGAVTSISYRGLQGMVGATSDWYVWEAENWGNWRLRYADEVYLHPGDLGAVVFTRFLQPERPILPANIDASISLMEPNASRFRIYPNPVKSRLHIEGLDYQYVRLLDLQGRPVKEFSKGELVLLGDLEPAWYILQVSIGQGDYLNYRLLKD